LKKVIDAVREAERFDGGLFEFLFITSADRDATLQAEVRSHYRTHPGPFPVEVVFWQDVTADLAGDDQLIAKYWKGFAAPGKSEPETPEPRWLDRTFDPPGMVDNFQFDFALWPSPRLNLSTNELANEVQAVGRNRPGWTMVRVLLNQNPSHDSGDTRWSFEDKTYTNVRERWELEVGDHGCVTFRWGGRLTGTRYVDVVRFLESMIVPLALYKLAIRTACNRSSLSVPSNISTRLAAKGNGPLVLNDNIPLTAPAQRLSAPESVPEWKIECSVDLSAPVLESGLRLLNRAVSQFRLGPVPEFLRRAWGQGSAPPFLSIEESVFHKLYDPFLSGV